METGEQKPRRGRPRKHASPADAQEPTQDQQPSATPAETTQPVARAGDATAPPGPNLRISLIDRRMNDPFGLPSREVPLKGDKKGWVTRWFVRDAEHRDRHFHAVHRLYWTPLTAADLAVNPDELGLVVGPDKHIVQGTHSEEVLMAMPRDDYAKLQAFKTAANMRRLKGPQVRDQVSQETALAHGPEAGDLTYKHFEQRERTLTYGELLAEDARASGPKDGA